MAAALFQLNLRIKYSKECELNAIVSRIDPLAKQ